ncbi:PEGA domain-containing protein [Pendulispora rubella]|uniref:PEGA domain-containing protein n=1 Tax=Pendulispora rubella TaxID=2741070 RepID=A0ABZ2LIY3_9BACT
MRVLWPLFLILSSLFVVRVAPAAPPSPRGPETREDQAARERSRAAFRRGVAAAKAGNYAVARDAFEEAYRLFSHPSILLNLGLARAKTGEYVEAEQNLLSFLVDDGGAAPEEQKSARAALAEVRLHLGTLRIQVAPDGARATLDKKPLPLVPGGVSEVRVVAGEHALHAEADGYEPFDETIRVSPGKNTPKNVTLDARVADADGASGPKADVAKVERSKSETPALATTPPADAGTSNVRAMGWGLVAGGVAVAGFGTYAGLRALSLANEYERTGASDAKSSGVTFRTLADVSFLVGFATAGIGVYLLLSAPASKGEGKEGSAAVKSAHLAVSPGHAAIVGSF